MPKKFREAACFLTVLGLLVSFKTNSEDIQAAEKKDKQTTSGSKDSKSSNKKLHEKKDGEYDEEEGYLNIDWKFDFDNMKTKQIVKKNGYDYVVNEDSEAIIIGYDEKTVDKEKIKIPSTLGKHPVTMIYEEAFSGLQNAVTIKLPEGIEVIGSDAFSYSEKLQDINIPKTVKFIDSYAFDGCYALNNVTIPKNVENLGEGIFYDCISLKDITISSKIDELRYGFFAGCISLNDPDIPNYVKKIGEEVFSDCTSLIEVTIPNVVTSIGDSAFRICRNLSKITIPPSVTNISKNAFEDCSDELTIYLEKGSYADTYATKNKIKKVYIKIDDEKANENKDTNVKEDNEEKQEESQQVSTGIATTILNVRNGTSADNKQIGYLEKGMPVEIVKKYSNGWYKIKYNDSYGYVLGAYIKLDEDQEKISTGETKAVLNVRNGVLTTNRRIGQLEKGKKVNLVARYSNGWYKIKYADSYGYVSGAYIELDEEVKDIGTTKDNLNIRDGASLSNEQIGYLIKGKRVEIVDELKDGWYKIRYDDAYGYVSSKYIELGEKDDVETVATGETIDNLNVRSGSSTNKAKIGYLKKGTKVEVIKELLNGWYKIKYKGAYGYISGAYVKLDGDQGEVKSTGTTTSILKVRQGASVNNEQIGYLEKGKRVEIVTELLSGWYKIKYGDSYGYVSGAYIELNGSEGEVKATGETTVVLRVRHGASINNTKIGHLEKGTKVEIITELLNGWYKIKYKGAYGYVSGAYIKLDGDQEEVIDTGTTTASLNVRLDASTNSMRIGNIKKGQKVDIVKDLSNGWYKIKYKGSYGYISGLYVD